MLRRLGNHVGLFLTLSVCAALLPVCLMIENLTGKGR